MVTILELILRRLALSGLILLLVSAVVFLGTEILPGDALDASIPADELMYYTEEDLAMVECFDKEGDGLWHCRFQSDAAKDWYRKYRQGHSRWSRRRR